MTLDLNYPLQLRKKMKQRSSQLDKLMAQNNMGSEDILIITVIGRYTRANFQMIFTVAMVDSLTARKEKCTQDNLMVVNNMD